jgi:hypothetical protein
MQLAMYQFLYLRYQERIQAHIRNLAPMDQEVC